MNNLFSISRTLMTTLEIGIEKEKMKRVILQNNLYLGNQKA